MRPNAAGQYVLRFSIDDEDGLTRQVKRLLHVRDHDVELADVGARPELLESLAQETGGTMLRLDASANEIAAAVSGSLMESASSERKPIWDSWIRLALIVGLMTSEWIVRRRGGLA